MKFNTHDRTPRIKTNKMTKFLLFFGYGLLSSLLFFVAIATSVTADSIAPALIILAPFILLAVFFIIIISDMNKAYIKIDEANITITDYYFFVKKERVISMNDIKKAEIVPGYSSRICGYRYSMAGTSYIVFKNQNEKYLFKILNCPETNEYFGNYLKTKTA